MNIPDEDDADEARDALLIGIATVLFEMHPNDILGTSIRMFMQVKLRKWGYPPGDDKEANDDD